MFSKVKSCAVHGVDGRMIDVEADVNDGLPVFTMVGYLSSSVRESSERVRTALKNSGFHLPPKRITINLSPADMRKDGSGYDLAIATAVLLSLGVTAELPMEQTLVLGELSLDGSIKAIPGVLPMVICAREEGMTSCIVPKENVQEAALVQGISVIGVSSLQETMEYIQGIKEYENTNVRKPAVDTSEYLYDIDFSDVVGQESIKRGMEIAAAGFHNVLLTGAAGAGKSMLAKRLPTILPQMSFEESLEVTKIYSVGGMLPPEGGLIHRRPFRAPHHTISEYALIGGGRVPTPGEMSFAHYGVLFLDELPEFSKPVLEVLRQPLEDRRIRISRVQASYEFPADFMFVAAMNPCPCGNYPDYRRCSCTEQQIRRYQSKVSGPLLDRIDIRMEVKGVKQEALFSKQKTEASKTIRARVEQARQMQKKRFAGTGLLFNSQLDGRNLEEYIKLSAEGKRLVLQLFEEQELSVRGVHRVLKLARTIADLAGSEEIEHAHLQEAAFYRNQDVFAKEVLYGN